MEQRPETSLALQVLWLQDTSTSFNCIITFVLAGPWSPSTLPRCGIRIKRKRHCFPVIHRSRSNALTSDGVLVLNYRFTRLAADRSSPQPALHSSNIEQETMVASDWLLALSWNFPTASACWQPASALFYQDKLPQRSRETYGVTVSLLDFDQNILKRWNYVEFDGVHQTSHSRENLYWLSVLKAFPLLRPSSLDMVA